MILSLSRCTHDSGCRLSKRIAEDAVQPYFGDGHGVLKTILFRCAHISELEPVTAQFPEVTDIGRRDEGGNDQIHAKHACHMDSVTEICFLTFCLLDVFGMCQDRS